MIKKYFSLYANALLFLFIVFSIIIFPQEAYKASLEGLNLWFNVVCPSLLPFFICVEILIGLGVVSFIGSVFKPMMSTVFNMPGEGAFAFIMSVASGYPVGAKIIANLRRNKQCSQIEAQRMINLCSTSGPLFVIGAVSVGMLKKPLMAPLLLSAHYLSAISCGLIMRFYRKSEKPKTKSYFVNPFRELINYRKTDNRTIGELMGDSVKNGINLIILVGGYIIIFSVISRIVTVTGLLSIITQFANLLPCVHVSSTENISMIITGILEVTNGIKECAQIIMPDMTRALIVSFFIGFGGLSINAQVSGLIQDTDIKFSLYIFMKIIQGALAALYTYLLNKFGNLAVFNYEFSYSSYQSLVWYNTLMLSGKFLVLILSLLFFFSIFAYIFYILNKK